MRVIRLINLSGIRIAKARIGTTKSPTLHPYILARYENTRDPNCKGIKECKTLRRVRTGTDPRLAT
jgi:hypothetical protein